MAFDFGVIAMIRIQPIPAFSDNYIWCLHDGALAFVVDPGDAAPVLALLEREGLTLAGMLITHHHADHTGGIARLLRAYPHATVYGPPNPAIDGITHPLLDDDAIEVLGLSWTLLAVPGHTLDHLAYFCPNHEPPLLFCGDTLFAAGCGRLFEGSPEQMYASLQKLARLPPATAVYCAHEYTQSNLRFARAADPDNPAVAQRLDAVNRLRAEAKITLPSTIAQELETNPFLRCHMPGLLQTDELRSSGAHSPEQVFAALRAWKDRF